MAALTFTFTFSSAPYSQDGALYDGQRLLSTLSFQNNVATANLAPGDYWLFHRFYGADQTTCAVSGIENPGAGQSKIINVPATSYKIDDSKVNGQASRVFPFTVT